MSSIKVTALASMLLGGAILTAALPAGAQTINEFPLPQLPGGSPGDLIPSPDRLGIWFAEPNLSQIAEILPNGQVATFSTPTPNAAPANLFPGIANEIWFSEPGLSQIGMLSLNIDQGLQPIVEFPTPTLNSGPGSISRGFDFNLWRMPG
jgi:streptogramin lyase